MSLFGRRKPEPPVLDLRDEVVATVRGPIFEFGFPTRCPACGGRGYIDHVDLRGRVQFEHCPTDFTKWELREDDIVALNPA
jgi:hypothetical protein